MEETPDAPREDLTPLTPTRFGAESPAAPVPAPVAAAALPPPPPATVPGPPAEQPVPLTPHLQLVALALDATPGTVLEDDPDKVYFVGVWGPVGAMLPNYCCRLCKFATTGGPETLVVHFTARHLEPENEPQLRPRSGLVGPGGRPL